MTVGSEMRVNVGWVGRREVSLAKYPNAGILISSLEISFNKCSVFAYADTLRFKADSTRDRLKVRKGWCIYCCRYRKRSLSGFSLAGGKA